ncbi:MAG: hypothetical protein ABSC36_04295, partial [Gaiellaceae bacterium]
MLTPKATGVRETEAAVGEAEPINAKAATPQMIKAAKRRHDRRSEGLATQFVVDGIPLTDN